MGDETGPAEQLGLGAVVGDEMWDQQARVRLRLGPLTREQYQYERFLPKGSGYELLRTLARFFCHDQFDFDIQLVLAREEVPGCVLGSDAEEPTPLGWRTWLRTKPFAHDADDTILTL